MISRLDILHAKLLYFVRQMHQNIILNWSAIYLFTVLRLTSNEVLSSFVKAYAGKYVGIFGMPKKKLLAIVRASWSNLWYLNLRQNFSLIQKHKVKYLWHPHIPHPNIQFNALPYICDNFGAIHDSSNAHVTFKI